MTTRFGGLAAMLVLAATVLVGQRAHALPSFAQQTGQPCTACHIGAFGPQLTPTGRAFKIGGYTQTGGTGLISRIPLAGFILGSLTHTQTAQPTPPANNFGRNNNFALDQVSVFYAGRITDFMGAFVQGTYSGTSRGFVLDNTDVRIPLLHSWVRHPVSRRHLREG
jgi:hypothetical protein